MPQLTGVIGSTNSNGDVRGGVNGVNSGNGPGDSGKGVLGQSNADGGGIGVFGQVGGGKAVHGAASGTNGVGVLAEHTASGLGLAVEGGAGFSTGGSGTVAAGKDRGEVSNPAVRNTSHIGVTLVGNLEVIQAKRGDGDCPGRQALNAGAPVDVGTYPLDARIQCGRVISA